VKIDGTGGGALLRGRPQARFVGSEGRSSTTPDTSLKKNYPKKKKPRPAAAEWGFAFRLRGIQFFRKSYHFLEEMAGVPGFHA